MTQKIKVAILVLPSLALLTRPAMAVNTISHAETLGSNGAITTSSSAVPTAGGVTIGYFSGIAPTDVAIKNWSLSSAVSSLISNNWVDIRTVVGASSGMASGGDWDWPGGGSPGTPGTKIGGTYNWTFDAALAGKQLYIFAFNGGSSGYGYNGSGVLSPSSSAFTLSSFSGSTEWAVLKADTWLFPVSDGTALNIKVVDVDLSTELLIGIDGGNNIAMLSVAAVPEPSVASLLALGTVGLVALRARRKS